MAAHLIQPLANDVALRFILGAFTLTLCTFTSSTVTPSTRQKLFVGQGFGTRQLIIALVFFSTTLLAQPPAEPTVQTLRDSIEFGAISNATGICRVNRRGRLIGLGGQDCTGQGQSARYRVIGLANSVVNIQTAGSSSGNVSFTPSVGRRNTLRLNQRGRRGITVFGDLNIQGPAAGSYSLAYTVSINYE